MVARAMPISTGRQWPASPRQTLPMLGGARMARKASVSLSDRLSRKMKGAMAQPTSKGTRQPKSPICRGVSHSARRAPMPAAVTTATCWLADCQLT